MDYEAGTGMGIISLQAGGKGSINFQKTMRLKQKMEKNQVFKTNKSASSRKGNALRYFCKSSNESSAV
jgi:hypothetical protein